MKLMQIYSLIVVTAGMLLMLASCQREAAAAADASAVQQRAVRVAAAASPSLELGGASFSGVIKAQGQVKVGFRIGGLVTQVLVEEGDQVRRGQVLAKLDPVLLAAQREQAAGALGQAQAQLSLYEAGTRKQQVALVESQLRSAEAVQQRVAADYQRVQELYAQGVVARQKLDEAESAYRQACEGVASAEQQLAMAREGARPQEIEAARAAVTQAHGALAGAKRQLDYTTLTAPCDGTIVWRQVEVGMSVGDDPVFEIANLGALEVEAEVPESQLGAVKLGAVAQVSLPALPGQVWAAQVTSIAPQAQSMTRGFPIKLALDKPGAGVVPGMVALATLGGTGAVTGAYIQRRSLVDEHVFVVADGVAHRIPVQIVEDAGEYITVSGIEPGAQVVINGQHLLTDGEAVNVVTALAIDDITRLDSTDQH